MKPLRLITTVTLFLFLITGFSIISCGKENSVNEPVGPEPQKIQIADIKVYPGNKRIKFSWKLSVPTGSSAGHTIISWNANEDSLQVPATTKIGESVRDSVIVDSLSEGKYTFNFVATADDGTHSTQVLKKAQVYGPTYQASLKNREISNVFYNKDENTATVYWSSSNNHELATFLQYENSDDKPLNLRVSPSEDSTVLHNYRVDPKSVTFYYHSEFLPEPTVIDTFSASTNRINQRIVSWPDYFKPARGASAEGNIPPVCSDYPQTEGWKSEKVFYKNGRLQYKISQTEMHNRIPDYSYAGYHYGEKSLPDVPMVKTIGPSQGDGDDTQRIQNTINDVASQTSATNRGALLLEPGRYNIDGIIRVNHNGVVLRGSGSGTDTTDNTVIVARGNTPKQRTAIVVGTGDTKPFDKANGTEITDEFVPAGAQNFHIADPSHFSTGQQIYIHHPSTQAWINAVDGGGTAGEGPWIAGEEDISYIRKITRISDSQIYLDAPIFNSLDKSLGPSKVYHITNNHTISEAGVENLRVDIKTDGVGSEDEEHAWNAIGVYGAENSWVQGVATRHFTHSGVRVGGSLRITVKNASATDPVGIRTGRRFYNFDTYHYGQLVLFTSVYSKDGRHDFVNNGAESSSGIVWKNSKADNSYRNNSSEGHRHWTTGLLYDSITSSGLNINLYNRGDYGTKHGWSTANSTVWNSKVDIGVQKPPTAQNYGISGQGRLRTNYPFQGGATGYHDIRAGQLLNPASLYDAQLCDRLEN